MEWVLRGDPDPGVLVAGHSHRTCLADALGLLGPAERARRPAVLGARVPPGAHPAAQFQADSGYWGAAAAAGAPVGVTWHGNEHTIGFALAGDSLTVVGSRGPVEARAGAVVPYRMVRALWGPSMDDLARVLALFADPGLVVVLGTPPPKPEDRVRAGLAEPFFAAVLDGHGLTPATAPVAAAGTRVATWEALQDELARVAAGAGAAFLPSPARAADADGLLRDVYCAGDTTHANAVYGLLQWRDLLAATAGAAGGAPPRSAP